MSKKWIGVTLATAAAVAFASTAVVSTPAFAAKKVSCYGVNSCKGKGACKTAKNDCKGHNSCKGQGMSKMSAAKCKQKGGTTEETT